MGKRMTVHRDGKAIYDIVIQPSFDGLGQEAESLQIDGKKICIVTDSNVAPLYLKQVEEQLNPFCKQTDAFVFPAGEEHKNLDTVKHLYEFLIQNHYDRGDMLAALGGGVTGDLCGFAAATYLRGIRFIQIPTTLLSQVDSSIGGKTGVDFDAYKNMVGAFHMPSLVYTNTAALLTLPQDQYFSGMGEIIKHGLIKDKNYYYWLENHAEEIQKRNLSVCEEMIYVSNQIKKQVVEEDPTEKGDRALLNFGHTLGHAIEKLMNFQLLHGQCVALGSVAAAWISAERGMISKEEALHVRHMMELFHLPYSFGEIYLPFDEIIKTTKSDKKMDAGTIKFILLNEIGNAYVDPTVTEEEMKTGLTWLNNIEKTLGGCDEK